MHVSYSSVVTAPTRPLPFWVRLLLALALTSLLLLGLSARTLAQPRKTTAKTSSGGGPGYNTGIGLRIGSPSGVTIKHFFKSEVAFEAIVGTALQPAGLPGYAAG